MRGRAGWSSQINCAPDKRLAPAQLIKCRPKRRRVGLALGQAITTAHHWEKRMRTVALQHRSGRTQRFVRADRKPISGY